VPDAPTSGPPPIGSYADVVESDRVATDDRSMSTLPPPTTAPAGWYPDPYTGAYRYFDGVAWAPVGPAFDQRRAHPSLPMRAAVGALVVLVASLVVSKLVVDELVDLDWPLLVYVAILAAIGYGPSLGWVWYVRRRWGEGRFADLGWGFRWSDLGWGPLAWLTAVGIQLVMAAVVLVFDIPLSSNVEGVSELEADRAYVVATAITAVVAAPIVEEIVFRGVVMRGFLSRMAPVLAILLQGVLFGVAHIDPVRGSGNLGLAIVLSGVGIAFGGAAYLTRRVGTTVLAHAIFNGVVLVIVLTGVLDDVNDDFDREFGASGTVLVADAAALAPASPGVEHPVVDQPDLAEPRCHQHDHG
jgi:membrane protease YdiL (CAAX protease family)